MRKINFVAMLWVMALVGWFIGGTTLFVKLRFDLGEQVAVMKSTDPRLARALKFNPNDIVLADVVYETAGGPVPVSAKVVRQEDLEPLVEGRGVTLRFRKGNPREVLYGNEEKPWGIGWLVLGLVATTVALVAHRKLREEAA